MECGETAGWMEVRGTWYGTWPRQMLFYQLLITVLQVGQIAFGMDKTRASINSFRCFKFTRTCPFIAVAVSIFLMYSMVLSFVFCLATSAEVISMAVIEIDSLMASTVADSAGMYLFFTLFRPSMYYIILYCQLQHTTLFTSNHNYFS